MENTEKIINEKVEAFRLQLLKELVKPKFEVGRWYNYNDGIFNFQGIEKGLMTAYGICSDGSWLNEGACGNCFNEWTLATESEVLEALTKEYRKRGYERGYFKDVRDGKVMNNYTIREDITLNEGGLWVRGCGFVFDKGKWATVIPKEKTSADYVKEYSESLLKLEDFLNHYNLKITKA